MTSCSVDLYLYSYLYFVPTPPICLRSFLLSLLLNIFLYCMPPPSALQSARTNSTSSYPWPLRSRNPFIIMAHHDHHDYTSDQQYNSSQWELTCPQCFKTLSPDRCPIYNPDNCSCMDLSGLTLDDHPHSPSSPYGQQAYDEPAKFNYFRTAHSDASSNLGSIHCPEGPEREDPGNEPLMNNTHGYTNGELIRPLPICPLLGLNEERHRSLFSRNEMSYQLRRFLEADTDTYVPYSFPHIPAPSQTQYLSQAMHIQSQIVEKHGCGSKKSYRSKSSGKGAGSGESGGLGMATDMMSGIGEWDEDVGTGEYALALSGLTEAVDGE